jgi:hypothetical protein
MNFKTEHNNCTADRIMVRDGLDNWPDGMGGLITVDRCKLTGSRCDSFHCPKRNTHTDSHYDALNAVGLTESFDEEMGK